MAYRDYICCRDCKAKFIYDGNDSIRNSLEATYGNEDAPNWTVELVCPNCLAKLERNPLTEEEVSNLARTMVKGGKSVNWLCRAIEREHGIVSSQMQHIADLEAALAQPEQEPVAWMYHGIRFDDTSHDSPSLIWRPEYMDAMSASKKVKAVPLYTAPPQRQPLTDQTLWEMWVESPSDVLRFARAIERAHGIGGDV